MLSISQYKSIELLATGHSVAEAAREIEVTAQTVHGWMKNDSEYIQELSRATDTFAKEVVKTRSRTYRQINKKILDKLAEKIETSPDLDNMSIQDLAKLLEKTVGVMRTDEDVKKMPTTAIQNNIQINADLQNKVQQKEFAREFGALLSKNMTADDIEGIAQASEKARQQAERQK